MDKDREDQDEAMCRGRWGWTHLVGLGRMWVFQVHAAVRSRSQGNESFWSILASSPMIYTCKMKSPGLTSRLDSTRACHNREETYVKQGVSGIKRTSRE